MGLRAVRSWPYVAIGEGSFAPRTPLPVPIFNHAVRGMIRSCDD